MGGYQSLIRNLRSGLDRISEGRMVRPLDMQESSFAGIFLSDLFLCFLIMSIQTGRMTWRQFRKMKTRVQQTDADAYTVDGGALGELEYENFNAAGAKLHVYGRSVHPGSAKGKMKNAILNAQEFQKLLPVEQNPM